MTSLLVVGFNHRTAPVALREQLSLSGDKLRTALTQLATSDSAVPMCAESGPIPAAPEAIILSTCNRLESYVATADLAYDLTDVERVLAERTGLPVDALRPHLYVYTGRDAVEHLMRVASGLDSQILGESQILGQVVAALNAAQAAGASGALLSHLFTQAVHCGKRARTETAISAYSTSISHAAVHLIAAHVHDLRQLHVLVVGAGEMAVLAAQALHQHGVASLTFVNRTEARADELARRFDGRGLGWRHLVATLTACDVVVSATGAPHPVILRNQVAQAMAQRDGRPLLLVDIALPRDVDPEVENLPSVTRFDIDHLRDTVDANRALRLAAVPHVERIVAEEVERFLEWMSGRQVIPTLVNLRREAERVANIELTRTMRRLDGVDARVEHEVAHLAHRIIAKLLHQPTVRLKALAANDDGVAYAAMLQELFALTPAPVESPVDGSRGAVSHD